MDTMSHRDVGKFLVTISDAEGSFQLHFLDRRTTLSADCYCTTLLHLSEADMSPVFFSAGITQVVYRWDMPQSLVIMWRSNWSLSYSLFCWTVRSMRVTHLGCYLPSTLQNIKMENESFCFLFQAILIGYCKDSPKQ
jgi:hypothetical protein